MKAVNKRAFYDYEILEDLEAGIVLTGPEVKSVRAGRISLKGAYVKMLGGELWLINANISPYEYADNRDYNPTRMRKLLIKKGELISLNTKLKTRRLTLVPLSCYTMGRWIKIKVGLARGRKNYEKRERKRRQDIDREAERVLKDAEWF